MLSILVDSWHIAGLFSLRGGGRGSFSGLDPMARNAEVLGEITFTATLVARMMGQVRALMNMPRALLSTAGNAFRVVEMLTACEQMAEQMTAGDADRSATAAQRAQTSGRPVTKISFDEVTIVSPAGIELVNQLTVDVVVGRNLLVRGPNGVGKTSMFRAMQQLWPTTAGAISVPAPPTGRDGTAVVCYLPQVPYCVLGDLEAILTYPRRGEAIEPAALRRLLSEVELDHLVDRALESYRDVQDWNDSLSLGEKQRVGLARVLLHRPKFAVLDECMSTLAEDLVESFYAKCEVLGITCIRSTAPSSLIVHPFFGSHNHQALPPRASSVGSHNHQALPPHASSEGSHNHRLVLRNLKSPPPYCNL